MSIFYTEDELVSIVDEVYENQTREYRGVRIPHLAKLDGAILGLNTGLYYLWAGMSRSGKTTLLIQMMFSVLYGSLQKNALDNVQYVYFELEINKNMLIAKFTSLAIFILSKGEWSISVPKLLKFGNVGLSDNQMQIVEKYAHLIDPMLNRIRFVKKRTVNTTAKFIGECESILDRNGENITTLFAIDHIGKLCSSKKERMDEVSDAIVDLKNEYSQNAIFNVLQQANRSMYGTDRRKLDGTNIGFQPDDLKGTGNTMEDCDVCIAIHNPYELKDQTMMDGFELSRCSNGIRRMDFIKSRYGATYSIIFFMAGGTYIYELGTPSDEEYSNIHKLNLTWQT